MLFKTKARFILHKNISTTKEGLPNIHLAAIISSPCTPFFTSNTFAQTHFMRTGSKYFLTK